MIQKKEGGLSLGYSSNPHRIRSSRSSHNSVRSCGSTVLPPPSPSFSSTRLLLHGFACASCTEPGSTVNPAARTVATANTAAIKTVLFFIALKEDMKVYVYLS